MKIMTFSCILIFSMSTWAKKPLELSFKDRFEVKKVRPLKDLPPNHMKLFKGI